MQEPYFARDVLTFLTTHDIRKEARDRQFSVYDTWEKQSCQLGAAGGRPGARSLEGSRQAGPDWIQEPLLGSHSTKEAHTYSALRARNEFKPALPAALLVEWLLNKQNCRIWSEANPQVYVETPLHPEKLTVWCALWADGIIGPYFFKNDEGHNITVNGDRYIAMINNFFIPELNNHDVQKLWFQKDGATCHTARATIDLLKDTFGDRPISRFGSVNWPPRSCDLAPLTIFSGAM
ncbi:putative transposable element [Trichonephila clavipes]|nr:putative transposable element [Trichonephila clavipes]